MSDDEARAERTGDERTGDERTKDEKAVAALFASLVEGSPSSQLSPLEVVRLGRIEQRGAVDTRARRVRVVRNLLVAAVLVGAVVLVLPRLFSNSSSETATASMSSSSGASAPNAAAAPDAGSGYGSDASSAAVSAAGSSAASSGPMASSVMSAGSTSAGASSSGSAASGTPVPGAPPPRRTVAASGSEDGAASRPAQSEPVVAAAPSARPPSSAGPVPPDVPVSTAPRPRGAGGCRSLSASTIQAARSAFPAGYFDAPAVCTSTGVVLPSPASASSSVVLDVRKAKLGACLRPDAGAPCSTVAPPDVFARSQSSSTDDIWVYGRGYEVHLRVGGDPEKVTTDQLIAAGRAVIKALG